MKFDWFVFVEVKLVDVEAMGYTSKDKIDGVPHPRGESKSL